MSEDDFQVERDLFPAGSLEGENNYEVVVLTSDVSGAGTDSNVFILLYGSKVRGGGGHPGLQRGAIAVMAFDHLCEKQHTSKAIKQTTENLVLFCLTNVFWFCSVFKSFECQCHRCVSFSYCRPG